MSHPVSLGQLRIIISPFWTCITAKKCQKTILQQNMACGVVQALQIMKVRESGDQDNDHEGNSEEVVIKIMITKEMLGSGDQDNDHGVYS